MKVAIARDPDDPIAGSGPARWAVDRLRAALEARSARVTLGDTPDVADEGAARVAIGGPDARTVATVAGPATARLDVAESFAIGPGLVRGDLAIRGADVRGLVYGVLELADRVEHGPLDAALHPGPVVERPSNAVRSVMRLFCSEVEDKAWFHDATFWERYLSMLVAQRFNRFSLTLGLGYNYHRGVTDAYLYFAYPFLVDVPGHRVRVPQLPEGERAENLRMLRFISDQTAARGLDFQLGLWTHAYDWIDSRDAHHTVDGLTSETHAVYCRDAVRTLLEECPAIQGVTFRIHGESGIPEGSPAFWRTVFDGVAGCGRAVGLDLHAKGLDERTLSDALQTGLPVTVSPKFWAEHMGPPYHQAAIRERERRVREDPSRLSEWHRYMNVSEGSRPFTRYGYGDFLREDRAYDIVYRLWPGTQRLLLWGDPSFAAGYGRAASLAGASGLEWFEPLTFKGREGSGVSGPRSGYVDVELDTPHDWRKHAYTYRLIGRLTYDPDAEPDGWRRVLGAHFGATALHAEFALSRASRILPLVTVSHHASASNNYFWPEMYTDMPIVWSDERTRPHPYLDTPNPRRFGTVEPLDPEVFASVADFVDESARGDPSGRVSPLAVASWLEALARDASFDIDAVERGVERPDAEVRRWVADVRILAALGRFFAGKLRAAVAFERHACTSSGDDLASAVEAYRAARSAWIDAVTDATDVYVDDVTFGPQAWLRGHWSDRLAAIEADLDDMEARLSVAGGPRRPGRGAHAGAAGARPEIDPTQALHVVPPWFRPGEDLRLELRLTGALPNLVRGVRLRYRPMNHALAFREVGMAPQPAGGAFAASVPGGELTGEFPLAYAFVLRAHDEALRVPGLGRDLCAQPYHVVRRQPSA